MPGIPAMPKNSAYSDQPNAAITPTLISVSIVAAPWRAFTNAARWNGHAPHTATGAVRVKASHCQYVNCSSGIIDISATGTANAVLISSRRRSDTSSGSSAGVSVDVGSGAIGAGTAAEYPADSTAAISSAVSTPSARTRAFSVA